MKMKEWAAGRGDEAAKVDPKLAAVVTTVANIVITLELHQHLGLSPEQVLTTLLHVAMLVTILRSVQLSYNKRREKRQQAPD